MGRGESLPSEIPENLIARCSWHEVAHTGEAMVIRLDAHAHIHTHETCTLHGGECTHDKQKGIVFGWANFGFIKKESRDF